MLGGPIVRQLLAAGADVVAHVGPVGAPSFDLPDAVGNGYADIADKDAIAQLFSGAAAVVHLAGPPSAAASFVEPAEFSRAHVVGTAVALEACREQGVGRLIHVSSAEVYGQPRSNPVAEEAPTIPRSPYGAVKLGAEMLVRTLAPTAGIEAVVLRPFSVYGPRSPGHSLVGRVARAAAWGDEMRLATLQPVRDYLHVDDLALAIAAALGLASSGTGPVPVFNIASGTGVSVAQVAALAITGAGRDIDVIEASAAADRPASADVLELVADVRKARQQLGWVPTISLSDGLRGVVEAVRERA
jgi:nucleoside-diphosphate-sugar epimerase